MKHISDDASALLTFAPENKASAAARARWILGLSGAIIAVIGIGAAARIRERPASRSGGVTQSGTVTVQTSPAGADVDIDGQRQGTTPLTVTVKAGTHTMSIRRNGADRVVPLTVVAGSDVTQYLELGAPESPLPSSGRIVVTTEPGGARVTIDGHFSGTSPVDIGGIAATRHTVSVAADVGSASRVVDVEPGGTTSVVFSLSKPAAAAAGWLAIAAPFDVQVLERGEVIGSSDTPRIMLASGRHEFMVVNRALEYGETRTIDVAPGKLATLRIEAPKAPVSVNARPWAEVSIDAKDVGQTPIANFAVPIGRHEVVFRHPGLGERRQTVVVTTKGPNRIAADLNK